MPLRALDLFCGAGGASEGLSKHFDEVVGVDAKPQPRYPFSFVQGNALDLPAHFYFEFDFIWASPPCQAYVSMAHGGSPDLVVKTRALLVKLCLPWVIENVPSAPLLKFITLCGTMDEFPFLRVVRHRRFESSFFIPQPYHMPADEHPPVYSFDRRTKRLQGLNEDEDYITVAGNNASIGAMSDAMGIWWMTRPEITQAVPPVYSSYIAKQFIKTLTPDRPAMLARDL